MDKAKMLDVVARSAAQTARKRSDAIDKIVQYILMNTDVTVIADAKKTAERLLSDIELFHSPPYFDRCCDCGVECRGEQAQIRETLWVCKDCLYHYCQTCGTDLPSDVYEEGALFCDNCKRSFE